jgi:hypothetical protein
VSGELDPAECDTVEQHLAGCPTCLAEADGISAALVALTLLPERDRQDLIAGYLEGIEGPHEILLSAQPPQSASPPSASPQSASPQSASPPSASPQSASPPSASPPSARTPQSAKTSPTAQTPQSAPAGVPDTAPATRSNHPGPATRRRTRRWWFTAAAVAVIAVLSVSLVVGGLATRCGGPTPTVLTATAANQSDGATLGVYLADHGRSVSVRATVTGLRAGATYRLCAVGTDGRLIVVRTWTGQAGAQNVSGEAEISLDKLSFFSVLQDDGTPVVSAYIYPTGGPS